MLNCKLLYLVNTVGKEDIGKKGYGIPNTSGA